MNQNDGPPECKFASARNEINLWRARCIDEFCKGERKVGDCLSLALEKGVETRLRRQAGLRMDDLLKLADKFKGSVKGEERLSSAIDRWREIEGRRIFFAHGYAVELLDKRGGWTVMLTMVTGNSKRPDENRWCQTSEEAADFEQRLKNAYQDLSQQLGLLCARISA